MLHYILPDIFKGTDKSMGATGMLAVESFTFK